MYLNILHRVSYILNTLVITGKLVLRCYGGGLGARDVMWCCCLVGVARVTSGEMFEIRVCSLPALTVHRVFVERL